MVDSIECKYGPRSSITVAGWIAGGLLLASFAVLMGYVAATNRDGIFASSLALFMSVLASILSVLFLTSTCVALVRKPRCVLTPTEISAPRFGFSLTNAVVLLREVRKVEIQMLGNRRILNIYQSKGRLGIAESLLPSTDIFEKIHKYLATVVTREG